MKIETNGYNIPKVTIETALTADTKTEVGTTEDYEKFKVLTDKSGIFRGKIAVTTAGGSIPMNGTLLCNPWEDGSGKISITTLGNMGGDEPIVIQGVIENDSDTNKCYVTVGLFTPQAKS